MTKCFVLAGILEICIFLPDQRGIQFKVEGGRMATVEQLSSLLWTHLNLKHTIATEMFSLWMCSPLLGKFSDNFSHDL